MLKKIAKEKFLNILKHIKYGSITVSMPDGKIYDFEGKEKGRHVKFAINDERAIFEMITKGDIGLTESYGNNWCDTDDLENLLMFCLSNEEVLSKYMYGNGFSKFLSKIFYKLRNNTIKGSQRNIQAHYDLGNNFYELWLDQTMTYSSAIFENKNDNLEKAQKNKYQRIVERLNKNSGKLLEIGCGWGGFAEHAMTRNDYQIKGITLSNQQHDFATNRLKEKASIKLQDYRHQKGKFDNIVSIEMFEAVGEKYWPTYFKKIKELLNKKGKALIQTITIDEKHFPNYRNKGDMIRSYIFPGGMLPTKTHFEKISNKFDLKLNDNFHFGTDYAKTLKTWLDKFESQIPKIKKLGFDEKFIRIWRFYLTFCIAGFKTKRTDVIQFELAHA